MHHHIWHLSILGKSAIASVNLVTATAGADLIVIVTNEGADGIVVRSGNTVLRAIGPMQSGAVRCQGDVDVALAEGAKSAKGHFSLLVAG